ncbi:MAG: S41 family peptidase [Chlorobi bacterium]|nr:S41 family peptidase [Chlorobiota bacterium]
MKKFLNPKIRKPLTYFLFLFAIFSSFKIYDDDFDFETAKQFDLFHDIVREIRMYYVDDADIPVLIAKSSEEFLKKLDPYTVFYPEDKIEDFTLMKTGAYGGIGASIIRRKQSLRIQYVKENSPADKSGLKPGDEITAVNGIKINSENIEEILQNLKGEPGSSVNLLLKRYGVNGFIEKTIVREKISEKNIVFSDILSGGTGYIKLNSFTPGASDNFKKTLLDLNNRQKLSGLIIDLRNNPGGLLGEAVKIVNYFVPEGSDIVSTKGRVDSWNHDYRAEKEPLFPELPVVVLINNRSASASEIVAGALQDLDRAVIAGQRSFGKGLVQITRKLEYNTRIKITVAKYYIPSGRCIQIIDYSHRNADGSAGKIPDSLKHEFKTKNGRSVYDGGGIEPDIYIAPDTLSRFTENLIKNNIIFDFCTEFYFKHPTIDGKAENFSFTDSEYNEFIDFVLNSPVEFQSETSKLAGKIAYTAKKEHYDKSVLEIIKQLQKMSAVDSEQALKRFKPEILPVLERETVRRYYYEKGVIKRETKKDTLIKTAEQLLQNSAELRKILLEKSN